MSDEKHTTEAAPPRRAPPPPVNPLAAEPGETLDRAGAVVAFLKTLLVAEQIELEGEPLTGLYYILDGVHGALRYEAAVRKAGGA